MEEKNKKTIDMKRAVTRRKEEDPHGASDSCRLHAAPTVL